LVIRYFKLVTYKNRTKMLTEKTMARTLRLVFSGTTLAAGFGFAGAALAQTQEVQQAPIARVEITGSAIKRIDAETAVPVTVLRAEDLKREGITTIEQVMASLSVSQAQQTSSQAVGSSTGGASFADLRGIGANKTLVLLNGRRLANNAYDSSAPDLNMIPFAALERVEVLRDGASALYGSDAVGGVINFITKKNFQGGVVSAGLDSPQHPGGRGYNANVALGFGDLDTKGWNFSAVFDHQEQNHIGGTERPFNTRFAGGLSASTFPANYSQAISVKNPNGVAGNPAAPSCASGVALIPNGAGGCTMTTSSFVDYVPRSVRDSGLFRGTLALPGGHELGVEYLTSQSVVATQIAPVPYGNLTMLPNTPFYPNDPALDPTLPIKLRWRDLPNGARQDKNTNNQQRLVVSLQGNVAGWDYSTAATWNENRVKERLIGYSNGDIITQGVLTGIINPFGDQTAAGTALLNSAGLEGEVMHARGQSTGLDFHASRELGDWLNAGRNAGLALGAQAGYDKFTQAANTEFAEKVIASTGIDPATFNSGTRHTYAAYGELNVPILKSLDVTLSARYDKYSDFGTSTNPKISFRFQPVESVLFRGSYSTGFRAPSLYEIHSAQSFTNTGNTYNDPVNCPGGTAVPGKVPSDVCKQQFQALLGGNTALQPEKSKNATIGVVVEPIKDLSVGLDIWAISLRNTIGNLSQDFIFANPAKYAALFHRNPAGDLSVDGSQCPDPATCGYIDDRTQNLGGTITNGVDLSLNYRLRTRGYGTFTLASNATWIHKYQFQNEAGGTWNQNIGIYAPEGTGPVFRWQNTTNLIWNKDQMSAGLTAHYKTGYIDQINENVTNQPAGYRVPSYTTFDGYVAWNEKRGLGLTVGVRNLFDRNPPLSFQSSTFQAGYDPRYYDAIGRTFYARASYSF
jgi:iron complex outermembrane receptor protein